jgi:catechol-2,3-dioxygenase
VHLREIRVASERLEAQRALYAERFGLPVAREGAAPVVGIGDARLVLAPGEPSPQHFAIRIPSASYADALAWLGERVELLTDEDGGPAFAFPDWNADSAYFADPDGEHRRADRPPRPARAVRAAVRPLGAARDL